MPERKLTNDEVIDRLLSLEVCDVYLDIVDGDLISVRLHDYAGKDVFVFRVVSLCTDGHALLSVSVADQAEEDSNEVQD